MRIKLTFILFFVFSIVQSQSLFQFDKKKTKTVIPFQLISNLVFIPVELNGVKLTFLLDTGIEETILFSLDEADQVSLENIQKIKFRGFGINEPFEGLKSSKNKLKIKNLIDVNHDVYVVLDQDINISSSVGIPVNGIIGYHFFKNNCINIDYASKKVIVYNDVNSISSKKLNKFEKVPIQILDSKPYIVSSVQSIENDNYIDAKLLIDSGNSDSVWLFANQNNSIKKSNITIDDFLGKGFSGNVYGKRGRINSLKINGFEFKNSIAAFPDSINTSNLELVKDRLGSVGGEILKRFNVIFDYPTQNLYLAKNSNFNAEFNYNMSGIEIQHEGLQWVQEFFTDSPVVQYKTYDINGDDTAQKLKTKFSLKPSYTILSIRNNSPAEASGLRQGDTIIRINHKYAYNLSLAEINELLKSEEDKEINIEIERNNQKLNFKFNLKKMI
jgi:hypothetical protein